MYNFKSAERKCKKFWGRSISIQLSSMITTNIILIKRDLHAELTVVGLGFFYFLI